MNTKEYSDMHKTCVVNRERKLPLKDVARMLGYFKICDTPQRSHDHRFIYASGSKKGENMKLCYFNHVNFLRQLSFIVRVKVHRLHFKICNFTSRKMPEIFNGFMQCCFSCMKGLRQAFLINIVAGGGVV